MVVVAGPNQKLLSSFIIDHLEGQSFNKQNGNTRLIEDDPHCVPTKNP